MKAILPIFLFLSFFGCNKLTEVQPECNECETINLIDSVSSVKFWVNKTPNTVWIKDMVAENTEYIVCNPNTLSTVENTKIIEVTGEVFAPCYDSLEHNFIKISGFTIIETCLPTVDTIPGNKDLLGIWYFTSIYQGDTILPPCEAGEPSIRFYQREDKLVMEAYTGENSGLSKISLEENRIQVLDAIFTLAVAPTEAVRLFERSYCDLIDCSNLPSILEYTTQHNFLTLTNTQTSATAKLYTR